MQRIALLTMFAILLVFSALAQEDNGPTAEEEAEQLAEEETADDVVEPPAEEEEAEEPVVDDEFYQDVDDKDFRPSEEIPADQSIPFPSDI